MPNTKKSDKKVKVLVQFIQDRSGSMSSVWSETLSGFKNFVEGLKKGEKEDNVEYLFTLTTFDTLIETPAKEQPIDKVSEKLLESYGPRGSTALYDAVGKTLEGTKADADKYICVIVTDGQENSSREWSKDAVHAAIDAKIKLGNWTFTYLGTQPETWNDATSLGVGVGGTTIYNPTNAGDTYQLLNCSVRNLAASPNMMSANLMTDSQYSDQKAMHKIGMETKSSGGAAVNWQTPSPKKVEPPKKSQKSWR